MGVGQGVFPFGVEDQQPDIGWGRIKLRHQVLDEIALAVARPCKDEAAPALERRPTLNCTGTVFEFAMAIDQMPQRSGGAIVFEADVAQERQRRVRGRPHLAAQGRKGPLTHGELKLVVPDLDLQVPQQLHLQIVAKHLPHERCGHLVLGLGEIDQVGVAAIGRQLPRRVVAADAPHQCLAGA